jgi:hypothetical protein
MSVRTYSLLIELEKKFMFKKMNRPRIVEGALELNFKEEYLWADPEQGILSKRWKVLGREERTEKKIEKKNCVKTE